MMTLAPEELVALVRSVFPRFETDKTLAILVDVPREARLDNPAWKERRRLAGEWHVLLQARKAEIPLDAVQLIAYPDVGSNNADLPAGGFLLDGPLPDVAAELERAGKRVGFEQVFAATQLFLAPTEFSTTAPLKVAARRFRFRAATMPGFAASMIPALRIDYGEVARRVDALKSRLDEAEHADVSFTVDGRKEYAMHFDLRRRTAHASSGRFPEPASAGNLPSGEAYIVPYEGEAGETSLTAGVLPVEIDGEVVLFTVRANRAVAAEGDRARGAGGARASGRRAGLWQHGRAGVRRAGRLRPGADRRDPARREAGLAHRLRAQRAFRGRRGAQGFLLADGGHPPRPHLHSPGAAAHRGGRCHPGPWRRAQRDRHGRRRLYDFLSG